MIRYVFLLAPPLLGQWFSNFQADFRLSLTPHAFTLLFRPNTQPQGPQQLSPSAVPLLSQGLSLVVKVGLQNIVFFFLGTASLSPLSPLLCPAQSAAQPSPLAPLIHHTYTKCGGAQQQLQLHCPTPSGRGGGGGGGGGAIGNPDRTMRAQANGMGCSSSASLANVGPNAARSLSIDRLSSLAARLTATIRHTVTPIYRTYLSELHSILHHRHDSTHRPHSACKQQ